MTERMWCTFIASTKDDARSTGLGQHLSGVVPYWRSHVGLELTSAELVPHNSCRLVNQPHQL